MNTYRMKPGFEIQAVDDSRVFNWRITAWDASGKRLHDVALTHRGALRKAKVMALRLEAGPLKKTAKELAKEKSLQRKIYGNRSV